MVLHKKLKLISSLSVIMLLVGPAHATVVACEQNKARYIDPESDLVFAFEEGAEASAFLQGFSIGSENSETKIEGFITLEGNPLRPIAYAVHQCPDGDITGEELAECTIWQGVPYGLYSDGAVGLLPDEDEPAVKQLLLPDFARSVMSKPIWNELNIDREPFEVFDLLDCGAK
ncbi:MAG: hypothetical protein ABJO57_17560 [Lentilitoribacter sp.]